MDWELTGLLSEVAAAPRARLPREVLADWFDEQGDPRGIWIRETLHLLDPFAPDSIIAAEAQTEEPRSEIEAAARTLWEESLPDDHSVIGLVYQAGIPTGLWMHAEDFLREGRTLLEVYPTVQGFRFDVVWSLSTLRKTSERIGELLSSELVSHLAHLDLSRNRIGNPGLRLLGRATRLRGLNELILTGCKVDASGLAAMVDSGSLVSLTRLDLDGNTLSEQAAHVLTDSALLDGLEWLDLSANHIRSDGATALARSSAVGRLRYLSLARTNLDDRGAAAIASSTNFMSLRYLDLSRNPLPLRMIEPMLGGVHFPKLEVLDLRGTGITSAALKRRTRALPFRVRLSGTDE